MIWYDAITKEPIAPGACEDSGVPSIDGYTCQKCKYEVKVQYEQQEIDLDGWVVAEIGFGFCDYCGYLMLTSV